IPGEADCDYHDAYASALVSHPEDLARTADLALRVVVSLGEVPLQAGPSRGPIPQMPKATTWVVVLQALPNQIVAAAVSDHRLTRSVWMPLPLAGGIVVDVRKG